MTAQEYLSKIRRLHFRIEAMKMRSAEYDQMSLSIPGPNYDKEIVSGTRNMDAPFVKWIYKRMEMDELIKEEESKLKSLKAEIALKIEEINGEELKTLLILRYFQFLNWDEISKKMYVSKATVYRWHDQALASIDVPLKDES